SSELIRFAVEVKDKPVGAAEILSSLEKAKKFGVENVVFLAVSKHQSKEKFIEVYERARDMDCMLTIYSDWEQFIKACITFSVGGPKNLSNAYKLVGHFL